MNTKSIATCLALLALAGVAFGQDLRSLGMRLRAAQESARLANVAAREAQSAAIREQIEADSYADKARELRDEGRKKVAIYEAALTAFERAKEAPAVEPEPEPVGDPYDRPGKGDRFERFDAFDAADRSADENKLAYLPPMRADRKRGPDRETYIGTKQYANESVGDIADVNFFTEWQKGIGVSRHNSSVLYTGDAIEANKGRLANGLSLFTVPAPGSIPKAGNVDIARCSFQPHPTFTGGNGFSPRESMKWGMRRYNLGDTTVIDCDFTDIPEEHGCYDDVSGHALYEGLTFLNVGAQALQICNRDVPYEQYKADNMPYTGKPMLFVENCHAVDNGYFAAKRAFCWTFFDPGTPENPATIVLRDSTWVCAYPPLEEKTNNRTTLNSPKAVQASKGLVVTQYDHTPVAPGEYCVEHLAVTNCVFDGTRCEGNPIAIRGVKRGLFDHCVFNFRSTRQNFVMLDDRSRANKSKTFVIQDCKSPSNTVVWIENQPVMYKGRPLSLHCPGRRFVIDVPTRTVTEEPMRYEQITDLESPLKGRGGDTVPSGFTPQPAGAVMDMGTVAPTYRRAG